MRTAGLRRDGLATAVGAASVGAVAATLGLAHLSRRPLWMDEALDVHFTSEPWHQLLNVIRAMEMSQALFLLILKPWLTVATTAEWAARLPSVVFAAAAAALMVPLGQRLLGSLLAGCAAGLLLACNAFGVEWSQQARTYTLAMLACVIVSYLFVQAAESDTWRWWLIYGVAAGLAVYAHFFVALVLIAHYPALIALGRPKAVKRWAFAVGIGIVVAAPALNFAVNHDNGQAGWVPPLSWRLVDETIESLGGENGVLLGLALVGVGVLCRRVRRDAPGAWKGALIVAWVAVPLLVALAVSVVKPVYADRYLIVVLPALALSAAAVIAAAGRSTAIVALAATIAFSGAGVRGWYESPIEQDWRAAAAIVDQRAASGDAILVVPDWLTPVAGYYLDAPPQADGSAGGTTWIVAYFDRRAEVEKLVADTGQTIEERIDLPGVDVYRIVARPAS